MPRQLAGWFRSDWLMAIAVPSGLMSEVDCVVPRSLG
jgi:hypothetical protein